MTYRQTKNLVAAVGLNIEHPELHKETLAFIDSALDKQIETEPNTYEYKRDKYAYICKCGKEVYHGQKFCDVCGQALKWQDSGVTEICL
jgi:rRNA maturation endonuclease Nob1